MTKTLTVDVKQEHIDAGQKGVCGRCPVALAVKDTGIKFVKIGTFSMRWALGKKKQGPNYQGSLPGVAIGFIVDFDNGYEVEPFTFKVKGVLKS